MERKIFSIIGNIGFVAFLVIFPHFVPLPFYSYALVCLGAIFLMLRKEGKTFRDIGLIKGKFTSRAIILGFFTGLTWVAFMQFVYIPSIKYFFDVPDYTEYNFIKSNMTMLIMTVFAAIVIGGFYEEIVFRGYIQSVLEKRIFICFNPLISMLLTSLLFGIYHLQQDIFAVIAAFMGGIYWAILSKKFGNLWIPIISHALFDTVTLVLIYKGAFGGITY